MTTDEKALLKEIIACQNAVAPEEFTEREQEHLAEMARQGMVQLVWVVTPKGQRALKCR